MALVRVSRLAVTPEGRASLTPYCCSVSGAEWEQHMLLSETLVLSSFFWGLGGEVSSSFFEGGQYIRGFKTDMDWFKTKSTSRFSFLPVGQLLRPLQPMNKTPASLVLAKRWINHNSVTV